MSAPSRSAASHRLVAVALVFLGATLVVLQPVLAYDDQLKQLAAQLADAISKSGKKTVAVADFTDLDGNVTELGRFLAEETSGDLSASAKDFQVIDRTQLKATLKQHGLAANGILDPQTVSKLGDAAGVQAVVTATLTPLADNIHLEARLLDASNSAILGSATVEIPRSKDLNDLLSRSGPDAPAATPANAAPAATPSAPAQPPSAAPPEPKPPKPDKKNASTPKTPRAVAGALTGTGSVATDSYRVTVKSVQTYAGGNIGVTLEFTGLARGTVQLAMVRAGSYLADEFGVRWNMDEIDSAGIFNVKSTGIGGFWRGVSLAPGATIETTLVFTPPGQPRGTVYSLTILEFRPKFNRQLRLQGIK